MSPTLPKILLAAALSLGLAGCLGDDPMPESDLSKADERSEKYFVQSEYAYVDIVLESDRDAFFSVFETLSSEDCRAEELLGDGDSKEVVTVLAFGGPIRLESNSLALTRFTVTERPIEGCTDANEEDQPSEEDLEACESVKSMLAKIQIRSSVCGSG